MYDLHTHVLPNVDDGSKSVEESLQMLRLLKQHGVHTVVATPHYYQEMSLDAFLEQRANAVAALMPYVDELPQLILGAEVLLYPGLSARQGLRKLCIGETSYILIEMPYTHWQDWVFEEMFILIAKCGLRPIVAHLDRYIPLVEEKQLRKLMHLEVYAQLNADALIHPFRRKTGGRLLKYGQVHFLGSDCHNLSTRTPLSFPKMVRVIRKKWGAELLERFWQNAERMLKDQPI